MATRLERVVLELDDRFTPGTVKAAAAAMLLDKQLNRVSGSGVKASDGVSSFRKESDRASSSIDKLSGRLGLAARAVGALGPSLIPVVAGSTAALAGLAAQGMSVALGAGVVVTAFKGVGDALKAVNKAHLEPTTQNINAAREAMEKLAPAARQAVRAMREWQPILRDIRNNAASGFFPGFIDGLDQLKGLAPQVERIFAKVGDAAGDVFSDAAGGLSGPKGREFLTFIEGEAAPTLRQFGEIAGNVASAVGDLIMASAPLGRDFTGGLLDASQALATWADGLTSTDGYREFIDYVRDTGPQVMETVSSVADAFLQIGEAAAPLGGPVLQILEVVADTVAKIADSPAGPTIMAAVTATSALALATQAYNKVAGAAFVTKSTAGVRSGIRSMVADIDTLASGYMVAGARSEAMAKKQGEAASRLRSSGAKIGLASAAVGAAAVASAEGFDMQNTAMFAGIGLMAGPWGAAAGGAIGLTLDLAAAFDEGARSTEDWRSEISAAGADADRLRQVVADLRDATRGGATEGDGFWGSIKDGLTDSKAEEAAPALKEAKAALDEATLSAQEFASASGVAGASFTEMANAFTRANEVLSGRASLRAFEESVDAASKALKDNGRTLDINTAKGRANQAALDAIAGSAIKAAEELKGTDRVRVLTQARRDFINTAVAMGVPRAEARKLADQLGLLDRTRANPRVDLDAKKAISQVLTFREYLNSLHDKTITINAVRGGYHGAVQGNKQMAQMDRNDYSSGGFTGAGGKFEPAGIVHRGEVVVPQELVRRDWSMLRSRYGHLPGFASGGLAGGSGGARGTGRDAEDAERHKSAKEIKKEREEREKSRRAAEKNRREDALRTAQAALDDATRLRDGLSSTVSGSLRSDIFARGSSGSRRVDWRKSLTRDITNAQAFNTARAKLVSNGLNGPAAEALFASGDLQAIQQFAGMSAAEIAEYEGLWAQRDALTGGAGRAVGDLVYGGQVAAAASARDKAQASLNAMGRHRPTRQQRESARNHRRNRRREPHRGRGGRGDRRRPVEINVQGDSSRDPVQMARETARRLAFEGE